MTPVVPQQPYLFQLFAEVFRPLPYIGNLFKLIPEDGYHLNHASIMSKGLDIFRWLFPSSSPGPDTTHTLTDSTPLADMISTCVDVESSFDAMSLSRPQICPDLPDVSPLPTPSPCDRGFESLLHFLQSHVTSHLTSLQQSGTFYEVFATFIVGPPDHPNAGAALHSHLVGCATTDPVTHHLALFVPAGPDYPYKGPPEWAPLIVHIAASLLWPDLPFLVTSPDYILGAQAPIDQLRRCWAIPPPSISLPHSTPSRDLMSFCTSLLLAPLPPLPPLTQHSPQISPLLLPLTSDITLRMKFYNS